MKLFEAVRDAWNYMTIDVDAIERDKTDSILAAVNRERVHRCSQILVDICHRLSKYGFELETISEALGLAKRKVDRWQAQAEKQSAYGPHVDAQNPRKANGHHK